MKLQSKVILTLASIWIIICAVIYIDAKMIIEKNYQKAELLLANKDTQRVKKAFENMLQTLRLYTISFSQWDDAYAFMQNKNKHFIDSNFVPGTFTSSQVNFFMYYATNGQLYEGQAYNLYKNVSMPIPENLLTYLTKNNFLVTPKNSAAGISGIFKIPEGFVVFSSMPVVTSEGKGPAHGALFIGFYLTEASIINLAKTVELPLHLIPLSSINSDPLASAAYQHLIKGSDPYITAKDANINLGFTLIRDINNNPIGILRMDLPRDLYAEGIMTINHYLAIVIILGVIILITMWYLLKLLVLNRIIDVSQQVVEINTTGQFYNRISTTANDEINQMVTSLNSMLELIELTQEQLKYRISRRTKDLEKLSHLNRNLFSEMNKQRSIEVKLREDEKILRQLAYYDTLTGLPNRAFFNELLLNALTQAGHTQNKIALFFLDIDKFKKINDTYGHEFGDLLLKEVANRLKNAIKDTDVASRIAGDEFVLFITQISQREEIDAVIEKLFTQLSAPMTLNNIEIKPAFSIGISIYPDDSTTVEELINQADLAMYYAKKREGNVYYYYSTIENARPEKLPY